jgi:outer membrane protein assembly factor BamB
LAWSDQHNLAWQTQIPGYGQSAPVVSGRRAFVTGVEGPHKETLLVSAIDMASGAGVWNHRSASSQRIEDSNMVSKAAPTGITYEDSIFTFFETGNILAFSQDGQPQWERSLTEEFGKFGGRHGIGSSLRLCRAGILALVAHDRPSYLICLDPKNGSTVWKANRPEGVSWSTPTVVEHAGRELALISGGDVVEAYDTSDGSKLWALEGLEGAFIASPTSIPGGAIIGSSTKGHTTAIRFGDDAAAPPSIAWRASEASSYFSSPLVHRGLVYMVNKAGVAFCLKAGSGEGVWHTRLEGQCWASPIGCSDRVYFFGVDGVTHVVRAAETFELLSKNSLSIEGRLYGIAVTDEGLLLRYGRDLVRVQQS